MSKPLGLILDLDGTLVDTLADIAAALNHTTEPEGFGPMSLAEVRKHVGDGLDNLIARAVSDHKPKTVEPLIRRFRAYYAEHLLDESVLYPGWPTALSGIAELNVPMAVLSNKPDDFTKTICEKLLANWPVVHAEGQIDGVPIKPDPTRALAIADILGIDPTRVMFVGDSEVDMQTAVNAKMTPVGVTWGFRDRRVVIESGARQLLEEPVELLRLIQASLADQQ